MNERCGFRAAPIAVVLPILLSLSAQVALAQDAWNFRIAGQIGGYCRAVQAIGNYAYIGEGGSLRVVDLFDPTLPVPMGRIVLPGIVLEIFVSGNLAYVAAGSYLNIVDISNPSSLVLRAAWRTPTGIVVQSVFVAGSYAYVLSGWSDGLYIVDVSDPTRPRLVSTYSQGITGGSDVYVSQGLAFVTAGTSGLHIIDVSNPSAPTFRGIYDTPGSACDVWVSNQVAYVADGTYGASDGGLRIIDVSNASSPVLLSSYYPAGAIYGAVDVQVLGSLAYVSFIHHSGRILDVSNPAAPVLRGQFYAAWDLSVSGDLACLAIEDLYVFDVVPPETATLLGRYSMDVPYPNGVFVIDGTAYVSGGGGLDIIDVRNPLDLTVYSKYPGGFSSVDVKDGLAYCGHPGLTIIDVSDPWSPVSRGFCAIPPDVTTRVRVSKGVTLEKDPPPRKDGVDSLSVPEISAIPAMTVGPMDKETQSGDLAFLGAWGGLYIMDVTDPSSPSLCAQMPIGIVSDVDAQGALAYVAWHNNASSGGLLIIDASRPTSPTVRGSYETSPWRATSVHVKGNRAYLAAANIHVLDVSNPSQPVLLAKGGGANALFVTDGLRAYATFPGAGSVGVWDLSNLSAMTLQGYIGIYAQANVQDVFIYNGLAYVPGADAGLFILEYTGPPQRPSNVAPVNNASGVSIWPTLRASPFADLWRPEMHQASHWQVRVTGGGYTAPVWESGVDLTNLTSIDVPPGYLSFGTRYYWHARYRDFRGNLSPWSYETSFVTTSTTTNRSPATPVNQTPAGGATDVTLAPILIASAFSDPDPGDYHLSSQWQIRSFVGTYSSPVYDSGVTHNLTSLGVQPGTLVGDHLYYWRVRYMDAYGAWSNWSQETSFQTATAPVITTPQGLRASPGAQSVRLTWRPNSDTALAGYNLYRDTSIGGAFATKINAALITNTEYLDDGLSPGTTHWYKITARANDGSESPKSAAVSATPGTTKISMPDIRALAGSTVTLLVNLDNANGVSGYGMDIKISYDAATLTPIDFHKTPLTDSFLFMSNIEQAAGQVNFSGISGTGTTIVGEGAILTVDFMVATATAPWTTSSLAFVEVYLYDAVPNPIAVDYSDTALFTCAANYILGDLNGDGIITSADALIAQRIAMGELTPTPLQQTAGDLNGDLIIDSADVTLILRLAVGLPISESAAAPGLEQAEQTGLTYIVSVGQAIGSPGQTVAVPVTVSDATGLAGCELYVSYNPAHLVLQSVSRGTLTQNWTLQIRNLVGQLRLTASSPTKLGQGGGVLFLLNFRVRGDAQFGQTPLVATKVKLNGERGENLDWRNVVTVSHGWIGTGPTRAAPAWALYE